jgi:hypothetical protein
MLIGYNAERSKLFFQQLTTNLRAIPGVQSVGLATVRILKNNEWDNWVTVEGYTPRPGDRPDAFMNSVSPDYFATMGVPVIAGRDFTTQDTGELLHREPDNWVPAKIIVNESFVKRYFNDQAFLPYLASRNQGGMTVFVRTAGDPDSMFSILRAKIRDLDANLPVYGMRTVQEDLNDTLVTERMTANLSAVFGFLATLVAMIGLYGVMAYSVARRTREIGIRMALGALEGNVVWMVMKEVLLLVVLGVTAALPAAFGLTRLVRAQLYGVAPNDPWTMLIATVGLTLVACAAGYVPALRASRIDPIRALRYE